MLSAVLRLSLNLVQVGGLDLSEDLNSLSIALAANHKDSNYEIKLEGFSGMAIFFKQK
jgi:hypothetical protein